MGLTRRTAGTLAVAIMTAALVGFALFGAAVARYAAGRDLPPATLDEGIVVLTGGEGRIAEGIRLFDQRQARRLLISGAHAATTKDNLQRRAALPAVLFDCCVDVGYAALHTVGNAAEAQAWATAWGFKRLVVVTSSYHMPRALIELSRAMPDVVLLPRGVTPRRSTIGPWWLEAETLRLVAIEYVKSIPAWLRWSAARMGLRAAPMADVGAVAFVVPER